MNSIRDSLAPFLLVSTAFHLLLVLSWYGRHDRQTAPEEIRVSVIPGAREQREAPPPPAPRRVTAKAAQPRAEVAKKPPPGTQAAQELDKTPMKSAKRDRFGEREQVRAQQPATPKVQTSENGTAVSRDLPTLKDLLPPVYQAYSERRGDNEPPRLNTQDPKSASFFTSVKQAIDANWVYPAMALRYGLEGKLLLEFTILQNGQLDEIRLIRSSGSSVLDQEAIRAVQAAAPFRPIPSWIKARRLVIPFSFTYEGAAEARLRSTMSDATAVR